MGSQDSDAYREHLEDQLLRNEIKALIATTALVMGYDKPDLGFVVHYQAPGSIVAYYQQVGRAGRRIARSASSCQQRGRRHSRVLPWQRVPARTARAVDPGGALKQATA